MAEATKPLDYVMIKHMGYSAETRRHRAVRAGQRRQKFILDNGRPIRGKGERFTEVSFTDLLKNFNMLLGGVRSGAIRVCRPDNLQPFSLAQLADLGARLAKDYEHDLKVDETLLEPLVADQTDTQVWIPVPKGSVDTTETPTEAKEALAEVMSAVTAEVPVQPSVEPTTAEGAPAEEDEHQRKTRKARSRT
jgi:hypothetical protein